MDMYGCLWPFAVDSGHCRVPTDIRLRNTTTFGNVIQSSSLILDYYLSALFGLLRRHGWTTVYLIYDIAGTAMAASYQTAMAVQEARGLSVYSRPINPAKTDFDVLLRAAKSKARG